MNLLMCRYINNSGKKVEDICLWKKKIKKKKEMIKRIGDDRVQKIRLTGPLAKPKKETGPTKHSGPFAKPQRRGMPIAAFKPFGASPE